MCEKFQLRNEPNSFKLFGQILSFVERVVRNQIAFVTPLTYQLIKKLVNEKCSLKTQLKVLLIIKTMRFV